MTVLEVQQILASLGYKPGPLDGIWGRKTAQAVRAFQISENLEPDAVVGPMTRAAMLRASTLGPVSDGLLLPWFSEAARQYGTKEVPGPASNHTILNWAEGQGIPYRSDDIAWCGLFVAHCIGSTLEREPMPSNPLGARKWLNFGIGTKPTRGAVLVFWRSSINSWKGHVGFYAGEDENAFCVLGGNQANSVSLAWISKDRLLDARWPATVPPPIQSETIKLARGDAEISVNEA